MTDALTRLIAEAAVLAGGKHPCAILGHRWRFIGCAPRETNGCWYSVPVHECDACGDCDYGDNDEADEAEERAKRMSEDD